MDIRIVIFLASVSVSVVTNALLLWVVYKGFANFTMKITQAAREFETSSTTREWLDTLQHASNEVVSLTEKATQRIANYDPVLQRAQSRYGYTLAKIDRRFEELEYRISTRMHGLREKVEGPAAKIRAFASGMKGVAGRFGMADVE